MAFGDLVQAKRGTTNVTLNSAPTAGNLLVYGSFSNGNTSFTPPTGFTGGTSVNAGGGNSRGMRMSWKISAGNETGALAPASGTNTYCVVAEYQGPFEAVPLDVENAQLVASGSAFDSPSVSPTSGVQSLLVALQGSENAGGTAWGATATVNGSGTGVVEDLATTGDGFIFHQVIASTSGSYVANGDNTTTSVAGASAVALFKPQIPLAPSAQTETSKLTDIVIASLTVLQLLIPSESVKVTENPTISFPPIEISLQENAALRDGGAAQRDGITRLEGVLRVTDGPPIAAIVGGDVDLSTSLSESLVVTDAAFRTLDPEQANRQEALRLSDIVAVTIDPERANLTEALRIIDALTVSRDLTAEAGEAVRVADSALVTLDPEQAAPSEITKVTDSVTTNLDPEQAAPAEIVRIADALTVALQLATSLQESARVTESAAGVTDALATLVPEAVRVSDIVIAKRYGDALLEAEQSRVSDVVFASLDQIVSLSESIRIFEELALNLGSGTFQVETLRLVDIATAVIDPEQTTQGETVRITDEAFAALQLSAEVSEAVRVIDLSDLTLSPEQAQRSEQLVVSDIVAARLGDVIANVAEAVLVTDVVFASRDLTASLAESTTVVDAHIVGRDIEAALSESVAVSDTLTVTEDPLVAALEESLRAVDQVATFIDLSAAVSEEARVIDGVPTVILFVPQISRINVGGTYRLTVAVGGTYSQSIVLDGTYRPTIEVTGNWEGE